MENRWNEKEVEALNWLQTCGIVPPYLCRGDQSIPFCKHPLLATENGFVCRNCSYTQSWHYGCAVKLMNKWKKKQKDFQQQYSVG